jgi:nitrogen regulatory protein PII
MKKLEIIFPKSFMDELMELLAKGEFTGYTMLEIYKGYGSHYGESLEFGFSSSQNHFYLFSICDDEILENFLARNLDRIKDSGGRVWYIDVNQV